MKRENKTKTKHNANTEEEVKRQLNIMSSGLSRDDEHLRKALIARQKSHEAPLSEAEELWLSLLNDRYEKFLDEGLQAMRAHLPREKGGGGWSHGSSTSNSNSSSSSSGSPSVAKAVTSFLSKLRGNVTSSALSTQTPQKKPPTGDGSESPGVTSSSFAMYDNDDSSVAAGGIFEDVITSPGNFAGGNNNNNNSSEVPHRSACHWSWVLNRLVVGAVPLADPSVTDPSAHLKGLRGQCKERGIQIGLVVSCIDFHAEMSRAGERLEQFASPRDWDSMMGVSTFRELALPEDPLCMIEDVKPEDTIAVCRTMTETMLGGKAVYLHCKAGRVRSWCIAMCFLVSQRGMSFDQAQECLKRTRPCMTGSPVHAIYVQQVVEWAAAHPLPPVQLQKPKPKLAAPLESPAQRKSEAVVAAPATTASSSAAAPVSVVALTPAAIATMSTDDNNNNTTKQANDPARGRGISLILDPNSPDVVKRRDVIAERSAHQQSPQLSEELMRQRTRENDERYRLLLADLLQLPAAYRVLILEDLARLT